MKLTDLDPKLTATQLRFRCPNCGEHWIMIPVNSPGFSWKAVGTIENLTVTPSIDAKTPPCRWHGWITNGEVRNA